MMHAFFAPPGGKLTQAGEPLQRQTAYHSDRELSNEEHKSGHKLSFVTQTLNVSIQTPSWYLYTPVAD